MLRTLAPRKPYRALVVVPDHRQRRPPAAIREEGDQLLLPVVHVLVLVDEKVPEAAADLLQSSGVLIEKIDHLVDDVVEVREIVRIPVRDVAVATHRRRQRCVPDRVDVDLLLVYDVESREERVERLAVCTGTRSAAQPVEAYPVAVLEPYEVRGDQCRLPRLVHDFEYPVARLAFPEHPQAVRMDGPDEHLTE